MINLNSIMIGSHDPKKLAAFYEKVFARPADMVDGDWHGWKAGNTFLSIGSHSKITGPAKEPERIMMNFETSDVAGEFARMKALGATVVAEPYTMGEAWIATLADPDNNFLQLMTPWESKA